MRIGIEGVFDNRPIPAEQRLFLGVVVNAIREAAGFVNAPLNSQERQHAQDAALAWIIEGGADFCYVCSLAGLEPDAVQSGTVHYLADLKAAVSGANGGKAVYRPRGRPPKASAAPREGCPKGAPTLSDVARHAGVSSMTVSRFLACPSRVGAGNAQRIRVALEATGYDCGDRQMSQYVH